MKKLYVFFFLVLAGIALRAQTYTEIPVSKLPKAAQDYIAKGMPGAEILRAVRVDDNGTIKYAAAFESRGRKHMLIFDKDGNFLQKGDGMMTGKKMSEAPKDKPSGEEKTKTPGASSSNFDMKSIDPSQLPAEVTSYVSKTYPGGKIVYARKITQKEIPFYQVTVNDGDKDHIVTFNGKGKYISHRTGAAAAGKKPTPLATSGTGTKPAEKESAKEQKEQPGNSGKPDAGKADKQHPEKNGKDKPHKKDKGSASEKAEPAKK